MKKSLIAILLLSFALAACDSLPTLTEDETTVIDEAPNTVVETQSEGEEVTPTDASTELEAVEVAQEPTDAPVVVEVVEEPIVEAQTVAYSAPAWANLELTDAVTGETFTLADYAGRTVFIEPMATWCTNCMAQQRRVAAAMAQFGDDVVFISLSVEPINNTQLANYAQQNNFPQQFVVGTNDLINALVEQFGRSIVSPPVTPHFIISPDGSLSPLFRGAHGEAQIIEQVQTAAGTSS